MLGLLTLPDGSCSRER